MYRQAGSGCGDEHNAELFYMIIIYTDVDYDSFQLYLLKTLTFNEVPKTLLIIVITNSKTSGLAIL